MRACWLEGERPGAPAQASIDVSTLLAQGVAYESLSTDPAGYQPALDALKSARGYLAQDEVALRPDNPDLETLCAKFVDEHHHDDDEVRFVLEGEGIFDIRTSDTDRWMRVLVEPGDLIVVPANRHHRFFMTEKNHIRCVRLFKDASGWIPHYR